MSRAYIVVDTIAPVGSQTPVLGNFNTEEQATEFISTLPYYESGRYGIDSVEDDAHCY